MLCCTSVSAYAGFLYLKNTPLKNTPLKNTPLKNTPLKKKS